MLARGYVIVIKHDGTDGSVYPVTTSSCSIGRAACNDIRFRVQSVSEEHCIICASFFKPAVLRNLSSSNPTEVNNVPVHESEHVLEHGDVITIGERSFRWEYRPTSLYYTPNKTKGTRPLSATPLPGSTGMVGVPISVLQSTLGSQPFSKQSLVIKGRKAKFFPPLVETDMHSDSSGDVPRIPSKLVAVVSPQRRPQSEKKAAEATNVSSPASKSVTPSRNQPSAASVDITPSNRKSSRLYIKSAGKSTGSDDGLKTLQTKRALQALVTTRKTRKSVGTLTRSQIPKLTYVLKDSDTEVPQSSKKSGNFKKMAAISTLRKTKSEQKVPLAATALERKRTLESGLRSAEIAAKRLKVESPKTPDKKKMAALLVCHGKVSRPKTPQLVSDVPHEVSDTSSVRSKRRTMTAESASRRLAVQKTAEKKYENVETSVGDKILSSKQAYSVEIPTYFGLSSGMVHEVKHSTLILSQTSRSSSLKTEKTVSPVKVTSRRKLAPSASSKGLHTAAAVCPTGRQSRTLSADHAHNSAKLKIRVSSDKKIRKRNVAKSLFRQLKNKSVHSTSASSSKKDANISAPLLNTPHMQRKPRSMAASCPPEEQKANSNELDSEVSSRRGCKGRLFNSSTPALKSRDARRSGSSMSLGVKTLSWTSEEDCKVASTSGSFQLKQVLSQTLSDSDGKISSIHVEGPNFSGSKHVESLNVSKFSGKCVQRLFISEESLDSFSPKTSLSAQDSQSDSYPTSSTSSSLKDTTFDFDSAQTPSITLDRLVSPLSSDGKRKSLSWQDESAYKENRKSAPLFKRPHMSESFGPEGIEQVSYNKSICDRVKTRFYCRSASPKFHGVHKLIKSVSRISKTPVNDTSAVRGSDISGVVSLRKIPSDLRSPRSDLRNISGVKQLMKTPKCPKSPKNDMRDVRGVRKLMKTPRSPKSPKNDLRDVRGLRKLMMTPKSPKSPKNDLRDVRGVKQLMTTPRSPKSPKNDLRDVRGVKQLMTTPRSPKSPKNDLRDVRGVKQLMTTPRSPKSPKNDLRDVCGVKQLMTTPRSPKSPKNDLRDVCGVKQLMTTPKSPKSPKNDLRNFCGVRKLMTTPRSPKSHKNDLRDARGVKRLTASPKGIKSPVIDVTDNHGVRRLMTAPLVKKSPKNDLTGLVGEKDLAKTSSPHSSSKTFTDTHDIHVHKKISLSPQGPECGYHTSQAKSTQTSPLTFIPQVLVPCVVTGTRCTRQGTKFIAEVPRADVITEMHVNQKTVSLPEDVKRSTRSKCSRKEPNLGILQAVDVSSKPHVKEPGQKKNKTGSKVELQLRNRKRVESKVSTVTEESVAQKNTEHLAASFPSLRTRRGRQVSSLPEQKQGVTVTLASSAVSEAKSPPAVSRRGGRKTAKKEVRPQLTRRYQTRAASGRKK